MQKERITVALDNELVVIMRKRRKEQGIPVSRTMTFALKEYLTKAGETLNC